MSDYIALNAADLWTLQVALLDLLIVVGMVAGLRYMSGLVANVDSGEMLATHDNFAFGLAFAGGLLGLAVMLTGVLSGDAGATLVDELLSMIGYGLLGLLLIRLGRLIQDRIVLPKITVQESIRDGNLAAAFVDVGNTIAIGIVLRAVMMWVETDRLFGLVFVLVAFVVSQLLMAIVTRYRLAVYASRHDGASLQSAFTDGNVALALRYAGHLIGVGLAVTAASGIVRYAPEQIAVSFLAWAVVIVIIALLLSGLAILARLVVLSGIDVVQ